MTAGRRRSNINPSDFSPKSPSHSTGEVVQFEEEQPFQKVGKQRPTVDWSESAAPENMGISGGSMEA